MFRLAHLASTTGPRTVPVRSGRETVGGQNAIPRPLGRVGAANRDSSRSVPRRPGVEIVSLVDGRLPHGLPLEIFTDEGVGTEAAN